MLGGYSGKMLEINLTTNKVKNFFPNEKRLRAFIGGKGLGARILIDELEPGADPLGPENPLIFATGPLTGTTAPTSGRFCVVTKSPATGLFLDSQVGGYFGPEMKFTGYDLIIIKGKASKLVYLLIENGKVSIEDASELMGKGIFETEETLKKRHPGVRVGSIGPAGEKLVKFACIGFDLYRQAGRGGAGCVMGSKNLKAIAVTGDRKVRYADEREFRALVKNAHHSIKTNDTVSLRTRYGTPLWVNPVNEAGLLPTKNFSKGVFDKADEISGEAMKERIWVKNKACFRCPIACGKLTEVKQGNYKGTVVEGPEYETLALMGSNCEIGSIEAIAMMNMLCDDLGLDTISTGNVLAFAMECHERGIIEEDLHFGDADTAIEMIKKLAYRKGLGDLLAEGVEKSSQSLEQDTETFAMHVKGLEVPGYDPRGAWGMALAYATSDRGACHQRAWTVADEIEGKLGPRYSTKGRAKLVKDKQDERSCCYSLLLCDFAPYDVKLFVQMLNAATGFDYTEDEYLKTGERIWNLTRVFNVRESVTRKDDTLPPRFMEEYLDQTDEKIVTSRNLDIMLDEYYQLRGWSDDGIPTQGKLEELGLDKGIY